MRPAALICGNDLRLLAADPYPVIVLILMPLVLLGFLSDGLAGGPGQSVPGLMMLFAFLGLYNVGLSFFRDHGWRTWSRMRTYPVGAGQMVLGKSVPLITMYLLQSIVLLGAGWAVFGMPMEGSPATLALVVVVIVGALYALGLLLVSLCRTMNQVTAVANLGGLLLAGLGGALAPVENLPSWAEQLAPLSPVYWALQALQGVIVDGKGVGELGGSLGVLGASAVLAWTLALARLDVTQTKEFYS
jgi:ABC-2 type transport system permease protein